MALRPADSTTDLRPRKHSRKAWKWKPAVHKFWRDLHELRLRTVENVPDDPLSEHDWWALVAVDLQATEATEASRRATITRDRLATQMRLPTGLWAMRRSYNESAGWCVAVRFEGYRPWWNRASEWTWHVGFAQSIACSYERQEPGLPPIADNAYGEIAVPDHIIERTRRKTVPMMYAALRADRMYNPYEEPADALLAPWGERWRAFDMAEAGRHLELRAFAAPGLSESE